MTMIDTKYGKIHDVTGPCDDDYTNMKLLHTGNGQTVKLQGPALLSYEAAAKITKGIPLTGSWRSCAYQAQLYASDAPAHTRYAPPDGTAHTRGLAIDVSTAIPATRFRAIHDALLAHGWHQPRADEPWHHSFRVNQ